MGGGTRKRLDLYYMPLSGPCRSVLLLAKKLKVNLNPIITNLLAGEHLKPDFIKMNPCHTIPTLNDEGFCLFESRAILQYLANRYGGSKNRHLYPEDPEKRALIDNMLYVDQSVYTSLYKYIGPAMFRNEPLNPENKAATEDQIGSLAMYLERSGGPYITGENLTIADYSIIATMTSIEETNQFELDKWPHLVEYMNRLKNEMENYQVLNGVGAKQYGGFVRGKLGSN